MAGGGRQEAGGRWRVAVGSSRGRLAGTRGKRGSYIINVSYGLIISLVFCIHCRPPPWRGTGERQEAHGL